MSKQVKKCNACFVSGTEKKLSLCVGCKAAVYCSKECQKKDWQEHKGLCRNNQLYGDLLKQRDQHIDSSDASQLPDGISLFQLNQHMAEWVRFHTPSFVGAIAHCLDLAHHPARMHTKVMHITLRPRPRALHHDSAGMYFEFLDAKMVDIKEALTFALPWPYLMMGLKSMQGEAEREGRGGVSAAIVEAKPLDPLAVPMGSLGLGAGYRWTEEDWKESLKYYINNGKRYSPGRGGRA